MSRTRSALATLALMGGLMGGCDQIKALIGGGSDEAAAQGEALLKSGDLPGAAGTWSAANADDPGSIAAATGAAYAALLQGDTAAADQILATAAATAGEALPQIELRRALVALAARDLEQVKAHGLASGLPAGQLFAAEVALADGERDEATPLLKSASAAGGPVGEAAQAYLSLIEDPEPLVAGLSEAQALWALGERAVAVKSVEELVKALPEERDRDAQLLVWSSRAATVGETGIARSLLDSVIFPPEGQAWRKVATAALIACAEGDVAGCTTKLDSLGGSAPAHGLADARATAAFIVAKTDPEGARKLAGSFDSDASARALLEAGDAAAAQRSAQGGVLAEYVKAGG